ncbi:MAG: methyltransferase domain-containing protein [Actinomycetota bacterium]
MADQWNPQTYEAFSDLRARPFWDLASLIDTTVAAPDAGAIRTMVDLGCGTGTLTAQLAQRLGVQRCVGVDSSAAMLERAAEHTDEIVEFRSGDISEWPGGPDDPGDSTEPVEPVDLVFSNAALQWLPDHAAVLARWIGGVRPGGQIAVQVPANADHPSHTCMVDVAYREPYLSAMQGEPPPDPVAANVSTPADYAELLHDLGGVDPHVRLQVYPQVMASTSAVVEWVSGTSLRRFFRVLPDELHQPFVDEYRDHLGATVGDRAPYFYAFKRILMWTATATS